MKKNYVNPKIKYVSFGNEDIVTTTSQIVNDAYNSISNESGTLKIKGNDNNKNKVIVITF
jgi:hypothetical protein